MSEIVRALGAIAEPPCPETRRLGELLGLPEEHSARDYAELFQLNLYPYASVYLGNEAVLGGEARDRIAGFWRAVGLVPPPDPDHLSCLLGLYASLSEDRPAEHAGRAFLWEHVLSWLPPYLDKVTEIGSPFYQGWAGLLRACLEAEAAQHPFEGRAPLHFREALPLSDPRDSGLTAFLDALLSPVRSGVILVRADLKRAARELGLGLRVGERRFIVRSLLEQDAPRTLAWLAGEADEAITRHRRLSGAILPLAEFWAARAESSAALLRGLANDARARAESPVPTAGSEARSRA